MSTHYLATHVELRPTSSGSQLLFLPRELQHQIVDYLDYPDLLSLKLSHPYFQHILLSSRPTIRERIGWVLSRGKQSLSVPHLQKTDFRSDQQFLQNPEVQRILRQRRCHKDCVNAALSKSKQPVDKVKTGNVWTLPCLVFQGQTCPRSGDFKTYTLFLCGPRVGRIWSSVKMNVKPWEWSWLTQQRAGQGRVGWTPTRDVSRTALVTDLIIPLIIVGTFWLCSKITAWWESGLFAC